MLMLCSGQHAVQNLIFKQRAEEHSGFENLHLSFSWGKVRNMSKTLKIVLLPSVGEGGGKL